MEFGLFMTDTKEGSGSAAGSGSGWTTRFGLAQTTTTAVATQAVCVLIGLSSLEDNSVRVCACAYAF